MPGQRHDRLQIGSGFHHGIDVIHPETVKRGPSPVQIPSDSGLGEITVQVFAARFFPWYRQERRVRCLAHGQRGQFVRQFAAYRLPGVAAVLAKFSG